MVRIITPLSPEADARNRAWRTFLQGLLFDVAVALVTTLAVALTSVEWTREYWLLLAGTLGKTAVMTVVSYLARKVTPPPTARPVAP